MRPRLLLGVLAVVLLILAIWLVPMALAAAGGSAGSPEPSGQAQAPPSGTECPFLQAHPWLDPHGSADGAGGPAATSGANGQIDYY
ncbi:MAG TPA: hypothetical protein VFZ86_08930 [Thermoleophilia bacterium]|nr:hypothetical protein [Thermoleophilia bacterium]